MLVDEQQMCGTRKVSVLICHLAVMMTTRRELELNSTLEIFH